MEPIGWFIAGISFVIAYQWVERLKERRVEKENPPLEKPANPGRMSVIKTPSGKVAVAQKRKPKHLSERDIVAKERKERGDQLG